MASENKYKVVLQYPGGEYEMDIVHATEGDDGININKLRTSTGLVTYDPGYQSTGSTKSAITYIDGENGILRYRGYAIEDLAEKATFNEVSYLLIHGELPTQHQLEVFSDSIRHHTLLDEDFKAAFSIFPRDAHPMAILASSLNILSAYYQDTLDPLNPEHLDKATVRLMAKVPMLAAYAQRARNGEPYMYPDNSLNARENFLRMMFGFPTEPYEVDPIMVKALDQLLILHADHEQNCSTSTVRMVASSRANMFVAIAAGINALSGPLHGGANQAVLAMLEKIKSEGIDAKKYMEKVKNKEDGVKLMGFGHRVYKNYDPRARIIKSTAHELLEKLGGDDTLELALELEEIALADDYFIERKLYPNVDFYTGLIYRAMGFPEDFFTVLFAIGRLPGWIAQYRELVENPKSKIYRPRQVYTGYSKREWIPRSERK